MQQFDKLNRKKYNSLSLKYKNKNCNNRMKNELQRKVVKCGRVHDEIYNLYDNNFHLKNCSISNYRYFLKCNLFSLPLK